MVRMAWVYAAAKFEPFELVATADVPDSALVRGALTEEARKALLMEVVSDACYSVDEVEIDVIENGRPTVEERWAREPGSKPLLTLELWPKFSMTLVRQAPIAVKHIKLGNVRVGKRATDLKPSTMSEHETIYDRRVCAYEAQGMTRSDAQAVVDAEEMQHGPAWILSAPLPSVGSQCLSDV